MSYNTDRRRPLTKKQRPIFLAAHHGLCHWCGKPILDDRWDDDHLVPKELMPPGSNWNDLSNRAPIHRDHCHKAKTARDIKAIRKSDRIRRGHGLDPDERQPRPKMRGRTFPKGPKQRIASRPFPRRQGQ